LLKGWRRKFCFDGHPQISIPPDPTVEEAIAVKALENDKPSKWIGEGLPAGLRSFFEE
jgi:hypothetical protein